MKSEVPGQPIIDQLFEAVELGQMARFQRLRGRLFELAHAQPQYQHWVRYFEGVNYKEYSVDWAQAERIFTELLQDEQVDRFLRSQIQLSLANTYFRQGLWARAIQSAEQTASLLQALDIPAEEAKAWLQIALASIKGFEQGDFGIHVLENAVEQCQKALHVLETISTPSSKVQLTKSSVWNTLGLAHRGLRNWPAAIHCFQQFLQISQDLNNIYYTAFAYCNLGEVYQRLGAAHWPQALSAYKDALSIFQQFSDRYQEIEVLANLGYLYQEQHEYEQALAYYDQTFQAIEQVRAGNTSEETRANFFATVTEAYANAILICVQQQQAKRALTYVEQARSRAFLDFLDADASLVAQAMASEPLALDDIQQALPEDALLLEYFTTGLIESRDVRATDDVQLERRRFPERKTLVFAVTRTAIAVYDTGLSPNHLYPNDLEAPVEELFLSTHMRRMLYKFLIAPCAEQVAQAARLYIVPHGPLHYIPYQALIADDGETLLRPDGPQIIYAPSATILLRHTGGRRQYAPSAAAHITTISCLAVGANGGSGTTQLRYAEEEASRIAQLVNGRTLRGEAARKNHILTYAKEAQLLHFSCHGTFNPELPLESALHLADGERLSAQEVIEKMRLRCALVTLSACESGLSRIRRGDELFGLVRAFMYAGAPALVVTQWRVDERSTHILMERFYEYIQSGMNFAEALRQAQLYLKDLSRRRVREILNRFDAKNSAELTDSVDLTGGEMADATSNLKNTDGHDTPRESSSAHPEDKIFSEPYYWAPFILIGDDRLVG